MVAKNSNYQTKPFGEIEWPEFLRLNDDGYGAACGWQGRPVQGF